MVVRLTMKIFYGLVHKDEESAFGITFPDAPGCFSAADEEADLLTNAQEALSLYVDGEAVPRTRTIAQLLRDPSVSAEIASGAFLLAVPLIESRRKARFNLMLDEELVTNMDRVAKVSGVSRSEFVALAVQSQLSSEVNAVFSRKSKGRLKRSATTGEFVATSSSAKVLGTKTATAAKKATASSIRTQKGSTEKTSAKVASSAAKILKSKTASKEAKSAAASALTQKKK
jgi:predicted RNase H-like HicB family nuclease